MIIDDTLNDLEIRRSKVLKDIKQNKKVDAIIKKYSKSKSISTIKKLSYPILGAIPFIQKYFDEKFDWYNSFSASRIGSITQILSSFYFYGVVRGPDEPTVFSLGGIAFLSGLEGISRFFKSHEKIMYIEDIVNFIDNPKDDPLIKKCGWGYLSIPSCVRDLEQGSPHGRGILGSVADITNYFKRKLQSNSQKVNAYKRAAIGNY